MTVALVSLLSLLCSAAIYVLGFKRGMRAERRAIAREAWCPPKAPQCHECGAYHDPYPECPLVKAGAIRWNLQ